MKEDADFPACLNCGSNVLTARAPRAPDVKWRCHGCGGTWPTPIPTAYPEPYREGATTEWDVFEALWRAYKRDETLPGKAGVTAQTVGREVGIDASTAGTRLRSLCEEGVATQLQGFDFGVSKRRATWAPTALLEEREPLVPGGPPR